MKTYTQEEYLNGYYYTTNPVNYMSTDGHVFFNTPRAFCSCSRFQSIRAFVDCANCLGYGIPPIPWSEVK